ncbi:elongation of fatty acids protein 2 [Mayamaea pseudoterrestris]|nr:elongation of fatty acids protein 2 [Mayamaea pseudoterrestris]
MGIKSLAKLLADEAPDCIREVELKSLHGRKIAIDASMAIYQFLIAVRTSGGNPNAQSFMLTNSEGETTSHIQGMFNRSIRFLTEGIRPVFVFDGAPPEIKSHELLKRRDKRTKAKAALVVATEEANVAELDKQNKRLVVAGRKENDECQKLLRLMGLPVVLAPCEAEAQAAALAKAGTVYATGTEDMDALTFQTPILIRKLTFANASKSTIQTIRYDKAIEGLNVTQEQFVDLCILLGCDYCDSIKGVGPKTALKMVRDHGSIENILKTIDRKRFTVPESWEPDRKPAAQEHGEAEDGTDDDSHDESDKKLSPQHGDDDGDADDETTIIPAYQQARRLFNEHPVLDNVQLKWTAPNVEELTKFLVDDCGFSAERVASNITKLQAAHKANSKPQMRMDNFFAAKPAAPGAVKRKPDAKASAKDKKAKAGGAKGKAGAAAAAKKK